MNSFNIAPFVTHYDKRYETDQQMLQRVAIKFAIIFFIIVMFDSLLDWTIVALYLVMHLVHMVIEAIEYSLVSLFAQMFQTSSHLSEIILVNAALLIALFFVYRSISAAPRWYKHLKRDLRVTWLRRIKRESSCWHATTLDHKIKCISAYGVGTTCLFLLVS